MIEVTEGVILRTRPLTETSLIVTWLTRDAGRISTVAKGARKTKSTFRGKLDIFYTAGLSFRRSQRSELHTLVEVNLLEPNEFLRRDLAKLTIASYCADLLQEATERDTPVPAYYALMLHALDKLRRSPATREFIFGFEIALLREAGVAPEPEIGTLLDEEKGDLRNVAGCRSPDESFARLSREAQNRLSWTLRRALCDYLGRDPKNRAAALDRLTK